MEWLTDPTIWVGLLTLIVLEVVLGIDNLVFIAILADKLPPHQRDKARVIGLSLALLMRLVLLSVMAQIIKLTNPLFSIWIFTFSWRDIILLAGGLFLLWKATTELHERLEGVQHAGPSKSGYASFWLVLLQIIVLDAVFSLDSIITAVGMVQHLPVMMAAVIIAMVVMIVASKPLTRFVSRHPTVVVLCLSFLLMIGLTLVAEGLGFHLPKGYLYAAIGFSIMIEALNQWRQRNMQRHVAQMPIRDRTAKAILRMLGDRNGLETSPEDDGADPIGDGASKAFADEERQMVGGVLALAERSVASIMTPRSEIEWIDIGDSRDSIYETLTTNPHSLFPVCDKSGLDNVLGVAKAKDLLADLVKNGVITVGENLQPALVVPETLSVIKLVGMFRQTRRQVALITDEYGTILGMATPMDVLEAIAGEFPEVGERLSIESLEPGHWSVDGLADLYELARETRISGLAEDAEEFTTLAGLMMSRLGRLPELGQVLEHRGLRFEVVEIEDKRIERVDVCLIRDDAPSDGQ
ncbi:membrane protein [Lampropedia cohaerens]|uniref:Membrane protein n=1 Tax=Lampropedia cohaerens TaxID=1610491 RepID=A0A0U1PYZ1_9BURK|nr:TerC family protein [Lampropedia cohaerens]KKW67575.1 membrane protein [Lampropedia cohaerens]